jgi:hypothetical protein
MILQPKFVLLWDVASWHKKYCQNLVKKQFEKGPIQSWKPLLISNKFAKIKINKFKNVIFAWYHSMAKKVIFSSAPKKSKYLTVAKGFQIGQMATLPL